jgi:hypothetical protein
VRDAIAERTYGFLVLVPSESGLENTLREALCRKQTTDARGAATIKQWKKLMALSQEAAFEVAPVPTPSTLSAALERLGEAA